MKAAITKTWLELDEGEEYIKVELQVKITKKQFIKMLNSSEMGDVELHGDW